MSLVGPKTYTPKPWTPNSRPKAKGTLLGTPSRESQENSRNTIEYKDPGRYISILFLLYSWGCMFGVPIKVPLAKGAPRTIIKGPSKKNSHLPPTPDEATCCLCEPRLGDEVPFRLFDPCAMCIRSYILLLACSNFKPLNETMI